ncbi:MAG: hypothetical protein JWQ98_2047 [Chlorobi bacterium]|nr:hypothetical protein [Chlorobiota bacterium]
MLVLEHRPAPGAAIALTISDMAGMIISTLNRPADGHAEIDTKGWPAGNYIVQATIGGETTSRRIMVMDN